MSKRAFAWTIWILLIVGLLGGAYLIVERANPGLRSSVEGAPAGALH